MSGQAVSALERELGYRGITKIKTITMATADGIGRLDAHCADNSGKFYTVGVDYKAADNKKRKRKILYQSST